MGFPRFAALIAFDEDKSTTIYRRFDRVAARDLLRMESELAWLEAEQDFLDKNIPKGLEPELSAALISTQEHKFHANYQWDQDFDAFCTKAQRGLQEVVSTTDTSASAGETWKESLENVYGLSPSQENYQATASELSWDLGNEMKAAVLDASSRALRSSLYSPKWIEQLRSLIMECKVYFKPLRHGSMPEPLRHDATIVLIKGWDFIQLLSVGRHPHFQAVLEDISAIYVRACQTEGTIEDDDVGLSQGYPYKMIALRESARRVRLKYAAKERLDISQKISSTIERYCKMIRLRPHRAPLNTANFRRRCPQIAK